MSLRKSYMFGVPISVFVLIVLGVIASFTVFVIFVIVALIPIVGYYVWSLRRKTKELEERVAALEGRAH